ncbi:hypothetical protein [Bartonella sp. AD13SXNS]
MAPIETVRGAVLGGIAGVAGGAVVNRWGAAALLIIGTATRGEH